MQNLFSLTPTQKNTTNFITFKNYGVLSHRFTDEELAPVWKEVKEIEKDFSKHDSLKNNTNLAGNIEKEYKLVESNDHLEKLISPLVEYYDMYSAYNSSVKNCTSDKYKLKGSWVNFQKKHEFNPNHNHGGFMSFVIWMKIPYSIEKEKQNLSGINSNANIPGHFQFLYTSILGETMSHVVPVDANMENTIMVFPAKLMHTVYPFYTSDDYRISISGNFYFDVS
jgi:hypothetical protein